MKAFGFIGAWIKSALVGPTGVILLFLGVYLLVLWLWRRRTHQPSRIPAVWGVGFSAAFLTLCLPYPGVLLDIPLEKWGAALERRRPVRWDGPPEPAAILVLGAGVTDSGALATESLNRLETALGIRRNHPGAYILFSDGGLSEYNGIERARRYLRARGVPDDRILLESKSLNTRENIVLSQPILAAHHVKRLVLVTTRRHLPRAYFVCRRVGLHPAVKGWYFPPSLAFCPTWGNLQRFSAVLNEYVGLVGYKLLGWE